MERKTKWYVLELDQFGQPNGTINEVWLTKTEAMETSYCFKKYESALIRAND